VRSIVLVGRMLLSLELPSSAEEWLCPEVSSSARIGRPVSLHHRSLSKPSARSKWGSSHDSILTSF